MLNHPLLQEIQNESKLILTTEMSNNTKVSIWMFKYHPMSYDDYKDLCIGKRKFRMFKYHPIPYDDYKDLYTSKT